MWPPILDTPADLPSPPPQRQKAIMELAETGFVNVVVNDPLQKTVHGKPFPLILKAAKKLNFVELQEFCRRNQTSLMKNVSEHGAVLFQGFEIKSGEEWGSVLRCCGMQETPYVGGAAVRKLIVGSEHRLQSLQVVTTNESPPTEPIPFHHELAQTPNPPSHICFYCQESSEGAEGGSTPLARSDALVDFLKEKHPAFLQRLQDAGVKYVKTAPAEDDPGSALGRSWKSMFAVQSKAAAEAAMKEEGYSWTWLDKDDCRIVSPKLQATRVASNGRLSFCNQIVAAYTGWVDSRNVPQKAVVFADDDSPMPPDALSDVVAWLKAQQVAYPWRSGDFCIVDNAVTCHAREPFDPSGGRVRRVLAAIGQGLKAPPPATAPTAVVLNSGDVMPMVGLGCWKIGKDTCADVVYSAIKAGYRLLDSAADYGNEVETGKGIRRAIEDKVCTREELFVVSKLWNSFHAPEHVEEACRKSLADLGLTYLDLYLIHFPIATRYVPIATRYPPEWFYDPSAKFPAMAFDEETTYDMTYRAMEALVDKQLVRNIGSCNINSTLLAQVLRYCRVKPAVLQVEMHPRNCQQRLLRFAREKGVQVMAFSNLGPASYVELGMANAQDSLLEHEAVKSIAAAVGRAPGQVLLRWGVQRGTVVIPKSSNPERLKQNLALFDFALSPEQMDSLDGLDQGRRFNDPGHFCEVAFNTFCPIYD